MPDPVSSRSPLTLISPSTFDLDRIKAELAALPPLPPMAQHHKESRPFSYEQVMKRVGGVLARAREAEKLMVDPFRYRHPDALASAQNFARYIGIRRKDIRNLQRVLRRMSLSSLGRSDTHCLCALQQVYFTLARLSEHLPAIVKPQFFPIDDLDYDHGKKILSRRAKELLGSKPPGHDARIMVTMPSQAAEEYDLVKQLIAGGMNVMRITCAHDNPEQWRKMVEHARLAQAELGRTCKILFDLGGPKLRTGPVENGAGLVHPRPIRSSGGPNAKPSYKPARIWLTSKMPPPSLDDAAVIPIAGDLLKEAREGDEIHFQEESGKRRSWVVTEKAEDGIWAESKSGAKVVENLELNLVRSGAPVQGSARILALPARPQPIPLQVGDYLVLTGSDIPGQPAEVNEKGEVIRRAHIGCTLPEVFKDACPGQPIYFDDGKIWGVIEEAQPEELLVRITQTQSDKPKLAPEKGINLPKTKYSLPALSCDDLSDLEVVASLSSEIDMVGQSFVNCAEDVEALYAKLDALGADKLGVILKIETRKGFDNLPEIILAALKRNCVGIMIARGDLALEVGFERMAEVQEEILSLCAAAHMPVIWATQVLETLAKKGTMPTRAEVSDAVMGGRCECVMLNKGDYILEALDFLDNVLTRMEGHQSKHFRRMRRLKVAARAYKRSNEHQPNRG